MTSLSATAPSPRLPSHYYSIVISAAFFSSSLVALCSLTLEDILICAGTSHKNASVLSFTKLQKWKYNIKGQRLLSPLERKNCVLDDYSFPQINLLGQKEFSKNEFLNFRDKIQK